MVSCREGLIVTKNSVLLFNFSQDDKTNLIAPIDTHYLCILFLVVHMLATFDPSTIENNISCTLKCRHCFQEQILNIGNNLEMMF